VRRRQLLGVVHILLTGARRDQVINKPTSHSKYIGAVSAAHGPLFASAPVAQTDAAGFSGRVFGEVWSDGTVRVSTTSSGLLRPALIALQHNPVVRPASPALSAAPLMGARADVSSSSSGTATYLGRAIVELFPTGAVVSVSGTDSAQVMAGLVRRLQQLA
jgi:hypothetical protein